MEEEEEEGGAQVSVPTGSCAPPRKLANGFVWEGLVVKWRMCTFFLFKRENPPTVFLRVSPRSSANGFSRRVGLTTGSCDGFLLL